MAKKKKFNPFKMLGSYVGLVLAFIIGASNGMFTSAAPSIVEFRSINIAPLIIIPILGFLLGWGIHSFFRSRTI